MKFWKSISVLGVASALLLSACASPDSSNDAEQIEPAGQPGGTIRVGVNSMPPGLGNPFTGIGAQSVYTWSATFDPLVMVNEEGVPSPWLSTEWRNVNPTTWEFDLRDDVKFSNREVFNAEAVKASIDYLTGEEGVTSVVGSELRMLASAEVLDPYTIEITTKNPDAGFPARLSAMYVVAPAAWAELGAEGFAVAPVGTGPFTIDSIDENKSTGTAFAESWRAPLADAIEITKLGDSAARLQALQSGQVDLAISLSPDQVPAIESSGATVYAKPAPQVMALAFTQTIGDGSKAINDPKVRIALNHAIDSQAIADTILGGLARPATQGSTPETFGYNPKITGYDFDPAKAKKMLAEAGYGDGLELSATVTVGSFPGDADIFQAVAAYLADVGVNVTFETVTFAPWLERYQQNTWTTDMFNQSWNTAPTSDAIRPATIFSCLKTNPFVCDEDLVPLLTEINAEFDPAAREKLLQELASEFYANPPSLLLVEQVDLNATTENTRGFYMASRYIQYELMTVK
jgi:peptide/nickel transport system substrate-binding protein